jgi:hypothetical protein
VAEGYKYDVFISYLRTYPNGQEAPTYTWVREYLHPELARWLPDYVDVGDETQIFLDDINIGGGIYWPSALEQALQTSRCLLAVLSKQYFAPQAQWCGAEFGTMQEREKLLGLRTQQDPSSLIYPVYFSNRESFPPEVQTRQGKDLSKFAWTYSAFKDTKDYGDFQATIKEVCQGLSEMIRKAPIWDKNWPVVRPKQILRSPTVQRPQL